MTIKTLATAVCVSLFTATSGIASTFAPAVGFIFTAQNAEFSVIQLPSLAAVNDPDGYTLLIDGQADVGVFASEVIDVSALGISEFTVSGIDPALMIDPDDPFAFPLGISLQNLDPLTGPTISREAIVAPAVPLPAGVVLLLSGIAGIAGLKRRKARAA